MNEVRLHVETLDAFVGRTMKIARELDRGARATKPADISFESMETLLRVLTPNRWVLLRTLHGIGPNSIRALAKALDRDYRGVHADVSVLLDAGLITRDEAGLVSVPWSRITAEMAFGAAA